MLTGDIELVGLRVPYTFTSMAEEYLRRVLFSYTRRTNYCVCTECRSHFMSSAPQPIMNQTRRFDSLLATVFIGTTSGADPNAPALFPAWHAPCMQLSSEGVDRRPVRGCPLPQPPRRQCAHTRPASGLRSPVSGRALFGVVAPAPRLEGCACGDGLSSCVSAEPCMLRGHLVSSSKSH